MKKTVCFVAGIAAGYLVSEYKEEIMDTTMRELIESARTRLEEMGLLEAEDPVKGGAAQMLADAEAEHGPVSDEAVQAVKDRTVVA